METSGCAGLCTEHGMAGRARGPLRSPARPRPPDRGRPRPGRGRGPGGLPAGLASGLDDIDRLILRAGKR